VARSVVIAVGASLAFIVGRDGSPVWQLARVLFVVVVAGLVYRMADREQCAGWAGVMFGAGCVAAAIGTGIGLPHLVKTGVEAMSVAGLIALGGGLVLVGASAASLLRSTSSWRRVLAVPAMIFTLFVVVWSLGQATAATNVPRTNLGSHTPRDIGLEYRDVEFETTDGVTLSAWYVPSTSGAAIVLLHGAGSTRSSVLNHAAVLAKHG
jgi:hypothetical protein